MKRCSANVEDFHCYTIKQSVDPSQGSEVLPCLIFFKHSMCIQGVQVQFFGWTENVFVNPRAVHWLSDVPVQHSKQDRVLVHFHQRVTRHA